MTVKSLRAAGGVLMLAVALAMASPLLAQEAAKPGAYGEEDRDWGIAATRQYRTTDYHAPTPREIPGGRVVGTYELSQIVAKEPRPYLLDVIGGGMHRTLNGAFWLPGAGAGDMNKEEESRFVKALASFAAGDKNRALVFFCVDSQCWLSYNAALRAIAAGYTNVMWYRGGVAAWRQADQLMAFSEPFHW